MSTASNSCRILSVGLVCLDIINLCDHYPAEDEDLRAREQQWRSGGNASNSSIVLSLLGRQCEFVGTLGHGMETDFAVALLDRFGIAHDHCVHHQACKLPTSYIVLNTSNGSRTIIHYRNLPELTFEDFCSASLDLSQYCWVHFEARNPCEYTKMVNHVVAYREQLQRTGRGDGGRSPELSAGSLRRGRLRVSVEVEKVKPELAVLVPLADVLLVSKEYAQYQGYHSMEEAVIQFRSKTKKDAIVVCAWGEKGAAASDSEGKVYSCEAFAPPQVLDTLGAGDTFNAGLIHRLSLGSTVEEALTFACRLAGAKCGMLGYEGLKDFDSVQTPARC